MPHDDWDDDADRSVLVGGLLMGAAALFVVAVLVWVTR